MAFSSLLIKLASLGVVVVVAQYIVAYLSSPLQKLPGPFVAKFSNWWRFWNHYSKTHIETQQALHKKYGSAVRIGPNTVSISYAYPGPEKQGNKRLSAIAGATEVEVRG